MSSLHIFVNITQRVLVEIVLVLSLQMSCKFFFVLKKINLVHHVVTVSSASLCSARPPFSPPELKEHPYTC